MNRSGYMSLRALAALTCWLIIAAGVVVAVSLHRSYSLSPRQEGVIALSPALAQLLFQVGAGDAVVAVSSFTELPAGVHRPVVGDNLRINREHTLWLQPRVIVYQQGTTSTLQQLGRDGIALEQIDIETIDDIISAMNKLVRIAGVGDARPGAMKIRADLDAVRRRTAGRLPYRVLLTMGHYPVGRRTFLDELLAAAGGENVVDIHGYSSKEFKVEQINKLQPQIIIDLAPELAGKGPVEIAHRREMWNVSPDVPAVRFGKVFIVTDPSITIPDVHVGESARQLAELIHPDAFATPTTQEDGESALGEPGGEPGRSEPGISEPGRPRPGQLSTTAESDD